MKTPRVNQLQATASPERNWQFRKPSGKSIRLWSCRLGFDPESSKSNDFKIDVHSFPAQRSALKCGEQRESVENKPTSLIAVPLGKAFNGFPPSWSGRQTAGNS